ncbi:MAG: Maf family protein [Candidatus Kapabacteria bacterium]|jgi:septum formation protein|nr:Maf family protein [Candidatus Kapabacteria bacterium]
MIQIARLINLRMPLVLASQSPRRKKLLDQLGFEFETMPANIDESLVENGHDPEKYVCELAEAKAQHIANSMMNRAIILGSDTIVVLNGQILNKPTDEEDARKMLRTLSHNTHTVYTGIALIEARSDKRMVTLQKTEVTFRELDDEEIAAYVATGSPLDKAGAYGIQDDFGAVFVSNISGCYYNIVGLPLELLYTTMKRFIKVLNQS